MPSLFTGAKGVKSFETAMAGVANNLANVSTHGFKHTRSLFDDIFLSQAQWGWKTPPGDQVGHGSNVMAQNMMFQGAMEATENVTDLAVSGRGFFRVVRPGGTQDFYTRAGQFQIDMEGYLVNPEGLRLQGLGGEVQIPFNPQAAAATTIVDLSINLDAGAPGFDQTQAIDPGDADTYNYANGFKVSDASGGSHDLVVFYQKMNNFVGDAPADSVNVWKAQVYESAGGVYNGNPVPPDNQFYLHFDSDGLLVGTSGPGFPAGDNYQMSGAVVPLATSSISNRTGESFTFTGEGGAQTFLSTTLLGLGGNWDAGDTITISKGGTVTTLGPGLTGGGALAQAINLSATGVHAQYNSATDQIILHGDGSAPASVTVSDGSIAIGDNNLQNLADAINAGVAASGSVAVDLNTWADGDTLTIGSNTWTYDSGGAADFTNLTQLAALAGGAGYAVDFYSSVGDPLDRTGHFFLTAGSVGTAANSDALGSSTSGTFAASGATLSGGMDSSAVTNVAAALESVTVPSAGFALALTRTDIGSGATLTLGAANTLGAALATPLDFNASTQITSASSGSSGSSQDGAVDFDFNFNVVNNETDPPIITPTPQQISFDFSPEDRQASTTQAGASEVVFLSEDSLKEGDLTGLKIDQDGVIWVIYDNGELVELETIELTGFTAPGELERRGDNLWLATDEAGEPVVGSAGDDNNLGDIQSQALELSTVDVAAEMVNMILYQRSFQANSKSITTSDEMLKTAINLKT